ncbi:LysR substrate-binding domain-containing protein [Rhodoligotrophos defluvii]|uniref:LysR substrate-binding domain-containing protein n=1 Tax=Rhodoligotrophos defluvii TaxID=2561934 RepID=UPI0010C9ECB4|nr:LysR substrate-binding domain-containing protein [Rhodoligotrophos defluvii]
MSRLPPLQTLRAFEAATRLGSFTAAARELNITQSAVSQQIQLLESALGRPLFRRLPRRLALTSAGELFAPAVRQALDLIGEAADRMHGDARPRELAVAVVPSLSARWLVSRLPLFHALYPDIDVSIYPAFEPSDVETCGADLGILYGGGRWRGVSCELLFRENVFPVCRPDLVSQPLESVDEIFGLPLLRDADARHEYWPAWLTAAGARRRVVDRGPRFDNLSDMITAATEGQGVALVRSLLVRDDLRAGRLERLFATEIPARYAYYLVWPKNARELAAGRAFRDWIIQKMTEMA